MNNVVSISKEIINIDELVNRIYKINTDIHELETQKQVLETKLAMELNHAEFGSKTTEINNFKVTLTSGYIYSIDKKKYEKIKMDAPFTQDPVKVKQSYEVDKAIIEDIEKHGSYEDLEILSQFITKKPKKLHVKVVKERG